MRITEPFVKVYYVLWLVSQGANIIEVSVDGAEPQPEIVAQILKLKGYQYQPLKDSTRAWTGKFLKSGVEVTVLSKPGIDIKAYFPDGTILKAECKGEPTPSGVKSGLDLTNFYTALGQLIMTADNEIGSSLSLALVMPETSRLRDIITRCSKNSRFKQLGIWLVLVGESGKITVITPN